MLLVNGNGYGSYECNNGGRGHGPVSSQSDLDNIAAKNCAGRRGGVKNTLCTGCGTAYNK